MTSSAASRTVRACSKRLNRFSLKSSCSTSTCPAKMAAGMGAKVVVLDVNLPDINGLTACRQVVQAHPEIKVIVFTAADDPDTRRRAFEAGACAVVDKVEFGGELLSTLKGLDEGRH